MRKLLTLLLMLLGSLTACRVQVASNQMSCDEILDDSLRSLNFSDLDPQSMHQWIENRYQLRDSDIQSLDYNDPYITSSLSWQYRGDSYLADFHNEDLKRIEVRWNSPQPTGGEIVECLGGPDFYRASYDLVGGGEADQLKLELWYPKQGIVVEHTRITKPIFRPKTITVHGSIPMSAIIIVKPGSVDRTVNDVYLGQSLDVRQSKQESLKSWPGEWKDLVVDIKTP